MSNVMTSAVGVNRSIVAPEDRDIEERRDGPSVLRRVRREDAAAGRTRLNGQAPAQVRVFAWKNVDLKVDRVDTNLGRRAVNVGNTEKSRCKVD